MTTFKSALAEIWVIHNAGHEFGTAFAIAPNRLVTAGHLFQSGCNSIVVRFNEEPDFQPTGVKMLWSKYEEHGLDIAVIECKLPNSIRVLDIAPCDVTTGGKFWETSGYPRIGDKVRPEGKTNHPTDFSGELTSVDVKSVTHQCDVKSFTAKIEEAKGLCGAPVVLTESQQVLGVIAQFNDGFNPVRLVFTNLLSLLSNQDFQKALRDGHTQRLKIAQRAREHCDVVATRWQKLTPDGETANRIRKICGLEMNLNWESTCKALVSTVTSPSIDGLKVFTQLLSLADDLEKMNSSEFSREVVQLAEAILPLYFPWNVYLTALAKLEDNHAVLMDLVKNEIGAQLVMATVDERTPRFWRESSSPTAPIWGDGSVRGPKGALGQPGFDAQCAQILFELIKDLLPGFYLNPPDAKMIQENIDRYASELDSAVLARSQERDVTPYCLLLSEGDGNESRVEAYRQVAALIPSLRFICVTDNALASAVEARIFTVLSRKLPFRTHY